MSTSAQSQVNTEGQTYSLLEVCNLFICHGVCLGNHRNQIDFRVESAHHFDIERLERMTRRLDEVDASMDTVVDNVHTIDLIFGFEVGVKSLLNVLHNGPPGIVIVHKVSETWRVNDCQAQSDSVFLDVGTDRLDRNGFWNNIEAGSLTFLWRIKRGVEQGIYQR